MHGRTVGPTGETGGDGGGVVGVLGAVQVLVPGAGAVVPPSSSQRRLLAVLALRALDGAGPASTDRLSALTETTSGSVRTTLSRLRRLLGRDVVTSAPDGHRLAVVVDAVVFERLADDGAVVGDRLARLDAALSLWRGPALDEFAHEPWARAAALRLDELRLVVVERRADELVRRGRADEAVAGLVAHLDQHPQRDEARRVLMEALAHTGRVAEALRAYHQRVVDRSMTAPPLPEALGRLERRIASGWTVTAA